MCKCKDLTTQPKHSLPTSPTLLVGIDTHIDPNIHGHLVETPHSDVSCPLCYTLDCRRKQSKEVPGHQTSVQSFHRPEGPADQWMCVTPMQ